MWKVNLHSCIGMIWFPSCPLGQVLTEVEREGSETPHMVAAFRLLILTGCRLGEIQTLKWDYITANGMELPDSKTGARRIPLPQPAREVLARLPRKRRDRDQPGRTHAYAGPTNPWPSGVPCSSVRGSAA